MKSSVSIAFDTAQNFKPATQASKRREMEKKIVTVKIDQGDGMIPKNEGPPSDLWSWRKYGQKPIKGSPYPRAYYRCSTKKGCSAKKQVERCKTDATLLLITYTSTHNHDENLDHRNPKKTRKDNGQMISSSKQPPDDGIINAVVGVDDQQPHEHRFHYLESTSNGIVMDQDNPFQHKHELLLLLSNVLFDEDLLPITYENGHMSSWTVNESKDNDFFDELEELAPISSSFANFTRSC